MKEPWNWDRKDLEDLIGQAESIRLEFKSCLLFNKSRENIAEDLSKEISAFANTEGGILAVGIKEEKLGKSRVASEIETGIDISAWSGQQIQQLIESNVSPYLTGLRVRSISVDDRNTKFVYVIYVPQGTTAYQANDRRYYGRSEYEAKPLPDHEIRLRMFRGKSVNGQIRLINCRIKESEAIYKNIKDFVPWQSHIFGKLGAREDKERVSFREYCFSLAVQNVGEINISEYKARINFSEFFSWASFELAVKDGWKGITNSRSFYAPVNPQPSLPTMKVNIYPQDNHEIKFMKFYFLQDENIADYEPALSWVLYLNNTLPIQGYIDIAQEFKNIPIEKIKPNKVDELEF